MRHRSSSKVPEQHLTESEPSHISPSPSTVGVLRMHSCRLRHMAGFAKKGGKKSDAVIADMKAFRLKMDIANSSDLWWLGAFFFARAAISRNSVCFFFFPTNKISTKARNTLTNRHAILMKQDQTVDSVQYGGSYIILWGCITVYIFNLLFG